MDSCGTQTVKRNLERKRSSKWPIAVKVTRAQKNDYIQRVRGKIQASGVGYPSEDAWRKKMVGLKAMQEKMEQIARDCRNLAEQNMERRSQACQNIKKVAFGL
jgi:phage protein U